MAKSGANAVKLQKRDNKSLYKKFYNSPYDNPNSYGVHMVCIGKIRI